jgi:hypothetical protein
VALADVGVIAGHSRAALDDRDCVRARREPEEYLAALAVVHVGAGSIPGQHVVLELVLVVRPIEATLPPLGEPVGDERAGDVARISFRPP